MIPPKDTSDWCANLPHYIPQSQVQVLCAERAPCTWSPYVESDNWLVMRYVNPGRIVKMTEGIAQGGGFKIPFVVPVIPVPLFIGWETEMQGTTEFYEGLFTPWIRERDRGWVVGKPILGAGIPNWAEVALEYEFTDKSSGWGGQLSGEIWNFKVELQPQQIWVKYEAERQWDPFVTEYSSAGGGLLIDLKDTMIVLARQQDVIDAGGYQAFGDRYVKGYQFKEVQAQSYDRGYLSLRFPHAIEVKP